MNDRRFFIDPSRCINCKTCEATCASRQDHGGISMIHFTTTYPGGTTGSFAQACMHCEDPLCVRVCEPAAIAIAADGTVLGVNGERCTGCGLCVQACPFEVPLIADRMSVAMKCDMCYERVVSGEKPMCTTACPTGALAYIPEEEVTLARGGEAVYTWKASGGSIHTKAGLVARRGDARFEDTPFDVAETLCEMSVNGYVSQAEGAR